MTTIEYLKQKIDVPENWEELTLKDYEGFYKQKPANIREKVSLIAHICKVDPEIILGWPAEAFPILVECAGFLFKPYEADPRPSVKIDGETFLINVEEKLSLGEYIDADEVQKSGENVLSNILAIVCRPYGEAYDPDKTEERAEMFANLSMSEIHPLLSFFLKCKNALEKHTEVFSCLTEAAALLPPLTQVLPRHGAGINLSQIWRILKYGILTALLRRQLRQLSRSHSLPGIRITRKKRKGLWTAK